MTTRALRRWWSVFKDLGFGGILATAWLILVSLAAIIAPWLPVSRRQNLRNIRAAPSWSHVFGTDSRGVDMLVRVIDGSRMSLLVGLLAGVINTPSINTSVRRLWPQMIEATLAAANAGNAESASSPMTATRSVGPRI